MSFVDSSKRFFITFAAAYLSAAYKTSDAHIASSEPIRMMKGFIAAALATVATLSEAASIGLQMQQANVSQESPARPAQKPH